VVALRSRRLETLFGADLDTITAAHIHGLVEIQAQEAYDLDFKEALYGSGDSEKRALAKAVAALANTAGGVIVFGVSEDEQARAKGAPGVDVTDAEVRRIRQVAASLLSPLPLFDVITIPDETTDRQAASSESTGDQNELPSAHGFILVAVPRSLKAPHAVLVNDDLRYPKRNGATTRFLSEPEVATAYEDRAAGAARQASRLTQIEREAFARIDREQQSWLMLALVPDLPGDFLITTASFDEFQRVTMDTDPAMLLRAGVTFQRISVGRRSLLADGTMDQSPLAKYSSLELHTDGAGTFGLWMYDMTEGRYTAALTKPPHQMLDDELIALAVVSGLLRLAQHARDRAAAGGNALVRATLLPASNADSIEIGHARDHGFPQSRSRTAVREAVRAEAVAALDHLASPSAPLIATAARLIDEMGQAFGIPELGQLTRDGRVRRPYWGVRRQQAVVEWAEQNEIQVTDDDLLRR